MNKVLTVSDKGKEIYNIYYEKDFSGLGEILAKFDLKKRKICIVSDTNVAEYYLEEVEAKLKECAGFVTSYVFPAGEASKNIDTVQLVYEHLILNHFDRNDMLVALGGGVVGDLTGFTAATYLRGIRFIQIPTSLLAMVDSSVGGKTGVDFMCYKNMVGAFHQPSAVYMNISALRTLTEEHYYNGFAEIVKYGMIQDAEFLSWITEHLGEIYQHEEAILQETVYKSCMFKRDIVQRDATEKGERALLNYGHTIGHSIEKNSNFSLLHGQCVALGMAAALYMNVKRGNVMEQELSAFENLLEVLKLPTKLKDMDVEKIIDGTKNDKKMEAGSIKFILLECIGKGYIDNTVTDEEMRDAINYLMNKKGN
ncbi:3-dehydroquinate synthase [[Clostridium] polysaccharolyticum]|uniref:3-dehydroquinate synthase n=1 Tax=[Clostridium] polysaccharolyticum TaxID=29364 RepID=A0A1I0E1J8_9FIRM|nr:3-dehydroquinate synthase [[Clostridium] polysaccharolyticum]SET38758.1 3-dehydroquinate synthase [[Clostridium] polysaccharolyticum]